MRRRVRKIKKLLMFGPAILGVVSIVLCILVLLAIGRPHEIAHGSLRLTISEETTKEDIDFTVDTLKEIIDRLRMMSPLYEDFVKKNK